MLSWWTAFDLFGRTFVCASSFMSFCLTIYSFFNPLKLVLYKPGISNGFFLEVPANFHHNCCCSPLSMQGLQTQVKVLSVWYIMFFFLQDIYVLILFLDSNYSLFTSKKGIRRIYWTIMNNHCCTPGHSLITRMKPHLCFNLGDDLWKFRLTFLCIVNVL